MNTQDDFRNVLKAVTRRIRSARRELFFQSVRVRGLLKIRMPLDYDMSRYGKKVFSQNDEDGILEYLFLCLGAGNKFFVEIGVGPPWSPKHGLAAVEDVGLECNTRLLAERDQWTGILLDGSKYPETLGVKQEFITAENVNEIFRKYDVPQVFDLFSLDIDGNDYWVWGALTYEPRVVVIEYNATLRADDSKTIRYDPTFSWSKRGFPNYYGASLLALCKLAKKKKYVLVYNNGVNAIFVKADLVPSHVGLDFRRKYIPLARASAPPYDDEWIEID